MVVMPEYLKASSKQNNSKPRIISEVRKNCLSKLKLGFTTSLQDLERSKFSGQLLWKKGNSEWALKLAEIRNGSLILINKEMTTMVELRLPLRELHLRPCNAPKTFCLAEANGLRLSIFQAITEEDYEKWVRLIAVELIRQTPLQNVRFLDILSIMRHSELHQKQLRRGRSMECLAKAEEAIWDSSKCLRRSVPRDSLNVNDEKAKRREIEDIVQPDSTDFCKTKARIQNSMPITLATKSGKVERKWLRTQSMNNLLVDPKETSDESGISSGDELQGETLRRMVDDLSFVPVRERKKFFESLNSGRKSDFRSEESSLSRSNSIGNMKNSVFDRFILRKRKRTKSLHDLHKTPVKEMCQFFESMEEAEDAKITANKLGSVLLMEKRLQRGERKLGKLRNQIADVEGNINLIAKDLKSIDRKNLKRQEGINAHLVLQRRMDEENSKLERLKVETTKVIKDNQLIIMKMERCNEQYSQ